MEEKKKITAQEAKLLSEQPVRLINLIFKHIKEAAEMGENVFDYRAHMSEKTQRFVERTLREFGYEVTSGVYDDTIVIVEDVDDANMYACRTVTLVISW